MNRSILIVICDFLLVSLLAFSTVDVKKMAAGGALRTSSEETATNLVESGKDLSAVMKLALDEERKNRDQLMSELAKTRHAVSEREQQAQAVQQQALQLQEQQTNLQEQVAAAQANIQSLNQRLQSSSTETALTKENLAAMEAEARKKSDQAATLQQQLAELSRSNQVVLTEKQQLASRLQLAEVERRHATEQVVQMTDEVKVERAEKAKLAEGVKALASNSGQLVQEIRDNRPLAPNTIFNEFVTNRVQVRFNAVKAGLFGSNHQKEAETVLVTDGTNTFVLCHVRDTPLTLFDPGTDWEGLTGTVARSWATFPIRSLNFCFNDPRVVWMPVTATEASQLGCKVYRISSDPFKFQDAVLVGTQDPYYGECGFEIDFSTPDYVKLDRNLLKGLFGKFNPSRGDLVISRTGELLGIMVNGTYCLMLRKFDAGATLRFGEDVRDEHTGTILAQLYGQIIQLPLKLQ